jgi:hypothetical protein
MESCFPTKSVMSKNKSNHTCFIKKITMKRLSEFYYGIAPMFLVLQFIVISDASNKASPKDLKLAIMGVGH